MHIGPTPVEDTFAEAFDMVFCRLIITAIDEQWADTAAAEVCGYGASIIGCDAEVGVEARLGREETPDDRPGVVVLFFGINDERLGKSVFKRIAQCAMTAPTTAVFDAAADPRTFVSLGDKIRYFGDGLQKSKQIGGVRYWRVPVMDGEFLVSERAGVSRGVAGGNIIVQAVDVETALTASSRAATAIEQSPGVMSPFPGGVVRSGSKVGSQYKALMASTADAYCPTVRGRGESKLLPDANAAYEIVIDGVSADAVAQAMRRALVAASGDGVVQLSAGNYGGKLGKHHLHLREVLATK